MIAFKLATPALALALALALAGCVSPQPVAAPTPQAPAAAPTIPALLADLGANVILPTYRDLDERAAAMHQAALALQSATTEANLQAARDAWKAARLSWELSESHLLGPVKDQDLDPALDSWPVNGTDLDKVLAGPDTFDEAYIAGQQPTLKGFHVIEYVLFAHQAAQIDARKLAYLTALTGEFRTNAKALRQAWEPTGGNFLAQYAQPSPGSAFGTSEVAFAETLQALAEICEEVANAKIEAPLAAQDVALEESRYSVNSLEDFRHNLTGVKDVYLGRHGDRQGLGLSHLIAAKDPALDGRMRTLIDQALADLNAVPGSFAEAIVKHPDSLRKAQGSINAVRSALQKDVSLSLTGKVVDDAT
jgi:predicted lipoprotein